MKRLMLLILLLLIPSAMAISTTMKPVYQPGETMIIEIKGNILQPIQASDIEFKRNNVLLAPQYDVKRIGEKYYLYTQIKPEQFSPNINYTLYIKDIATTINGIVTEINFNQTFIVEENSSTGIYSVNPGFLITINNLQFTMTLNSDTPISINADFPSEQSILLNPGQNQIILPISGAQPGFRLITLGIYQIPVMIISQNTQQNNSNANLRFFPPRIESTILLGNNKTYPFRIINDGETAISDAYFQFDSLLFEISPSIIPSIAPNQSAFFNLTIKRSSQQILSSILIMSGSFSQTMPISINFTQNISETKTPYLDNNNSQAQYYCQELGGDFCSADETCSSQPVASLDGSCCLTACEIEEKSSYSWLGWLFLAIAIIVIAFVVMKYIKGKKQNISSLQKAISSQQPNLKI